MAFDRYARPRHAGAALAAALALGAGVALIARSGGGGAEPRAKLARSAATARPSVARSGFPHTPAGAVAAATEWCQATGEAFFTGTWDRAAEPLAAPAFLPLAERVQPASAMVHRRLAAAHAPFAVRFWPLGYAVQAYSYLTARVRVWQLLVLGASGPLATTAFYTTTVSLRWTDGDWKITKVPPGPDLTPPGKHAGAGQVTSWVSAVDALRSYSYVP